MSTVSPPARAGWGRLRWPSGLSGPFFGLVLIIALFVILIGATGQPGELENYFSVRTLQLIALESSVRGVVALGMLCIIISGGIDLSVGSVVALVTVVAMQVYRAVYAETGSMAWASTVAIPAGVLIGGVCGLVNGFVVTRLRVTPFVATLGMYGIARGLAYWLSNRTQIAFPMNARPAWVDTFSFAFPGTTLFTPGFWSFVLLAALAALVLRRTVLGRYCYAIGSNENAARLCGVPVERYKLFFYALSGLLTGWAGVLLFARVGIGDPGGAKELELDVIAAVVIGGASLGGGQGTVMGTVLGVFILEVLRNGVKNFNVPIEVEHILLGVIIITNTALGHWRKHAAQVN